MLPNHGKEILNGSSAYVCEGTSALKNLMIKCYLQNTLKALQQAFLKLAVVVHLR